MKRSPLLLAVGTLLLAACGPAEVVVTVELQGDEDPRPISDLEIQLVPFDRDQVFDSLEAAYSEPEPEIPENILEAQQEIADAQREWRDLQERQAELRENLRNLSEELETLPQSAPRYRLLFGDFNDAEDELNRVTRQVEDAFEEFTTLQQANIAAADSIRVIREQWAMEAFADVDQAFLDATEASGLDFPVDTTDANGVARLQAKPGQYWVHARYEQAYSELYWNVPVQVEGGDPTTVTLSRENAEERPIL